MVFTDESSGTIVDRLFTDIPERDGCWSITTMPESFFWLELLTSLTGGLNASTGNQGPQPQFFIVVSPSWFASKHP